MTTENRREKNKKKNNKKTQKQKKEANSDITIIDKSSWEGCTTEQQSILIFKKENFSFGKYPRPPYSMMQYNRTITRTNINVLPNTGPATGERRKKKR